MHNLCMNMFNRGNDKVCGKKYQILSLLQYLSYCRELWPSMIYRSGSKRMQFDLSCLLPLFCSWTSGTDFEHKGRPCSIPTEIEVS